MRSQELDDIKEVRQRPNRKTRRSTIAILRKRKRGLNFTKPKKRK